MSIPDSVNFRRVSDAVTTSGSVSAEDLAGLSSEGYQVVVNLNPDGGYGAVDDEATIVSDQGVAYVYLPVDFAAPTRDDFDAFVVAMDAHEGEAIHVHCAANYRVERVLQRLRDAQGLVERGAGRSTRARPVGPDPVPGLGRVPRLRARPPRRLIAPRTTEPASQTRNMSGPATQVRC